MTYMIKMFNNIPGEPVLLSYDDFYHLVEMVRPEIKYFYNPWKHSAMEDSFHQQLNTS